MILELGQEICKMSLGHLVVCEKKVLKKKKKSNISRGMTKVCTKGANRKSTEGQSYNNLKIKIYKVILDFTPKCHTNTMSPY